MGILAKAKTAKPVPAVNAAVTNMRTVELPMPKTEAEANAAIAAFEQAEGKDVVAVCDFTGELISLEKNINVINNESRPELHGKVISTKALVQLLNGTVNAVTLPATKKPEKKTTAAK